MKDTKRYSTFAVMFYVNKGKVKKSGLVTIMGRISVSGDMTQFSTKIDIDHSAWDAKSYRIKGKGRAEAEINRKLDILTNDITAYHSELIEKQSYVTAELLKNRVCGIGQSKNTLLTLFAERNAEFAKIVGVNRAERSYVQYTNVYNHVSRFLKLRYDTEDIALTQLDQEFIEQFHLYLLRDKGFGVATVKGYTNTLRRIVASAVKSGVLRKDPFNNFKAENPKSQVRYMDEEDLRKMMGTPIESKALCFIRDMFVFSTFTGISFADMCNLTTDNIHREGRRMWIEFKRQKTENACYIPLLEIPRKIIKKYEPLRKSNKVFNMVTSATMRENLEKVVKLCGITNSVHYHAARHNFGTLITLLNGVPLETVSKMMGHSKITTTEIYARITSQKVGDDMKLLANGTRDKYNLLEDGNVPIITKSEFHKHMQK
ncbi:MAG: site-specific integrase [Rikenellaceae bacterium]